MLVLVEAAMSEMALLAPEYLMLCGVPRIEFLNRGKLICIRSRRGTSFTTLDLTKG